MLSVLPDHVLHTDMTETCIGICWERSRQATNRPGIGGLFLPAINFRAVALGFQP